MKQLFIISLLFIMSVPAFAVPGYAKKQAFLGEPKPYDVSEEQAYFTKLEKQFFERHKDGTGLNGQNYDKEVTVPYLDFTAELQKKGYPGFVKY